MRIVLTGGATGGHWLPFEPLVDTLRTVYAEQKERLPAWVEKDRVDIYFVGVVSDEARSYFDHLGVKTVAIAAGKLRRYPAVETFTDLLWRLPLGLLQSLWQLWRIMPDVVISKGGFGSLPVTAAAAFYRIPFLLHESDAVLGLANRIMAPAAAVITVGYANARRSVRYYRGKTLVTGIPVRVVPVLPEQRQLKQQLGFPENLPLLLVMGGSQGAQQINEVVLQMLPSLLPDMSVLHLTGPDHVTAVQKTAAETAKITAAGRYQAIGYLTDILPAMAAADVVITRAGANSLAELARLGKAIIVVPLSSAAQDHQRQNAAIFEAAGAARVIDPANLGRSLLLQSIHDLLDRLELKATLEQNIVLLDRPQAARDIALLTFKLAIGLVPRESEKAHV